MSASYLRISHVLGFFLCGIVLSSQVSNELKLDDTSEVEERIIGGTAASEGQFPWTAALYFQGQYACTASIISPTTLLTAAHCVVFDDGSRDESEYFAMVGSVNRSSSQAQRVGFSKIVVHPQYNQSTYDYDVAYIKLLGQLDFNDRIQQICLAREDTPFYGSYIFVTSMGWGQTNRFSDEKPDILHYASAKLLPHFTCKVRYLLQVTDRQLCADGFGKGVCKGDSGGPLVHLDGDATVQLGVASYVNALLGCGSFIVAPSVYVRVSAVVNWITQSSNDDEICTL